MAATIYDPKAFSQDLSRVITASRIAHATRACLLTTRDREHALNMVKSAALACQCPLYHFTVAGRSRFNPKALRWESIGSDSADALGLLRYAQELRGGGVVVFEDCLSFLRDSGGDQRMRMLLALMLAGEIEKEGLVLVFIAAPESAGDLPTVLSDQFVRLEVPYPRIDELEKLAREEIALMLHRTGRQGAADLIRKQACQLASGVVGLTRSAARDSLRDALAPDPENFEAARVRLDQRKARQLSRELAMNVLDTVGVEEPIGLDYLVSDLLIMRNKMRVVGPERAKGILLIGPPGTGKTMLARAIGKMVGLPVVEFKISALMNSLLGETERRFAQAYSVLETLSPNVVFIDEIEKAFGDSSERDGGTMMRCTGSLLSWLSDNPYPNFIVATSNNLRRMGEIGMTMTRSGRFDSAYFIDVPGPAPRRRMLERWLEGRIANSAQVAQLLSEATEKFSGADLRAVVNKAAARSEAGNVPLSTESLLTEIEKMRMRVISFHDEFQELRRWGRHNCEPAGPFEEGENLGH